jgi:hypothetical protein
MGELRGISGAQFHAVELVRSGPVGAEDEIAVVRGKACASK